MEELKVAGKSLKRARVSCDGYKKTLLQIIARGWNPEDNLDILNKMNEAMDIFIKCSDDLIILHDEGGAEEQKEIDVKDKSIIEYLAALNEFKAYRKNFQSNGDKYSKDNSKKIENSLTFMDVNNDIKITPLKIEVKMEPPEPIVKLEDSCPNKHVELVDNKGEILNTSLGIREETEVIKCGLCENDFIGKYEFQKHMETHEQYTCDICSFQTKTKKRLQQHISNHREKTSSKCIICAKQFSCKKSLKRHSQSCNEENIKRRKTIKKCDQCEYSSAWNENVKRHIEKMHINIKLKVPPYSKTKCDYCDYTSKYPNNVKKHMKCCSQTIERKMILAEKRKCKTCDYYSLTPSNVKKHMKRCQNILKRKESRKNKNMEHICNICGKSFKFRNAVEIHEYSHAKAKEPEEAVQCKICLNFFKTQEFLENHVKNHSEFEQTYQNLA